MRRYIITRNNGVLGCHFTTPRTLLDELYDALASGKAIGLCVNLDSSPMRTFGLDGIASSQEVLVKMIRLVGEDGSIAPSVPHACVPFGALYTPNFHPPSHDTGGNLFPHQIISRTAFLLQKKVFTSDWYSY